MQKKAFYLLALIAVVLPGNAQIYHYYTNSGTPWNGNKSYILNVGTDFSITSRNFGENTSGITSNPGLALSFRYEGDKNINERFTWGYQTEVIYLAQNFKYNKIDTYSGNTKHSDIRWWDLEIDLRLSLAYWIGDNIELQAAAGIYISPFFGISGESYETTATGTEVADSRKKEKGSSFNLGTGISTMLQAKYFFNENFFLSLNLHDNIGVSLFGKDFAIGGNSSQGGQRGVVLFGVGYKFIR